MANEQHLRLIDACVRRGAMLLQPVTAATWTVAASVRQSLEAWQQVSGLAGVEVPSETREAVLGELEGWAVSEFGELDRHFESRDAYVLRAVRLFPTR